MLKPDAGYSQVTDWLHFNRSTKNEALQHHCCSYIDYSAFQFAKCQFH